MLGDLSNTTSIKLLTKTILSATALLGAPPVLLLERDWAATFEEFNAVGTIVLTDTRSKNVEILAHDTKRAKERFSPGSTFKIAHSLFALDSGIVKNEHQIKWDKKKRPVKAWNRDQTLETAVANSVVWVFEGFADKLGDKQELKYLSQLGYGNCQTGQKPFWISGDLRISAYEQVEFLRGLHSESLPFKKTDQKLVRSVIKLETNEKWTLRGKTGWDGKIGWFVGWVEVSEGAVFFALNIDATKKSDLPAREKIVWNILSLVGVIPESKKADQAVPAKSERTGGE